MKTIQYLTIIPNSLFPINPISHSLTTIKSSSLIIHYYSYDFFTINNFHYYSNID